MSAQLEPIERELTGHLLALLTLVEPFKETHISVYSPTNIGIITGFMVFCLVSGLAAILTLKIIREHGDQSRDPRGAVLAMDSYSSVASHPDSCRQHGLTPR